MTCGAVLLIVGASTLFGKILTFEEAPQRLASIVLGISDDPHLVLLMIIGVLYGSIAGYAGGKVDMIMMRICDIIMSFPGIALAATFVLSFGASIPSLIFAIGFLYIPQLARIVRANIVSEYGQDYVRAVIVSGARAPWILMKHVVRNCLAPVMVFTIVLVADAIVFEASLSFISAGIPEPTPTWGNILADARNGVLSGRWWQALFGPGHHDHGSVPQHPVRGHHRRHGRCS